MLIRLSKSEVAILCKGYPREWKRNGDHDFVEVTRRGGLMEDLPHVISSIREKKQIEIPGCETEKERYFCLWGGKEVSALVALVIGGIRQNNLSVWVYRSGGGSKPFNHWLVVEG
jgi:hypothetical protein